ncbi:MAG: YdbH domain-containing protein, partial [Kiloniellales bacterium]
ETNAQLRFEPGMTLTVIALEELRLTASNLELAGTKLASLTVAGDLGGNPAILFGDLDISLDLAGFAREPFALGKTRLSLPTSVSWTREQLSANLRAAGSLEIEELAFEDTIALDEALSARIASASAAYSQKTGGGFFFTHNLDLAVDAIGANLTRADGDPLRVQGNIPNLHFRGTYTTGQPYWGRAEIKDARVRLPDYGVTLEQLVAELALDETGDAAVLHATARGPGGAGRIALQARHRFSDGRGDLDFELNPLTFAPGALQPGALAPALAALRAVTGTARADARLNWAPGRLEGDGHLVLEEFSFDSDDAKVEGLDLELSLDRLFPPGSPPGQRLTVRRVDPGVPVENLTIRYQLQPGPPPRLVIQEGEFEWSGGRFFVQDLVLDPKSERHNATLQVEDLDLAELFAVLNIDGLQGSGRISGALPFTIEDEAVTIRNAQLDAQEPGVIRYRSEQAEQVLAGGGESTELMLRALENFHYDQLSLGVEKSADGNLRVKTTLMGKNPDLLEGHPFRFNINLETDAGKLLAALSQLYSLSDRVLRRAGIFAR